MDTAYYIVLWSLILVAGIVVDATAFSCSSGLGDIRQKQLSSTAQDLVSSLYFGNSGTVKRSDIYRLINIQSIYNEAFNYLNEPVDDRWSESGNLRYLFKVTLNGSSVPPTFSDTDFPGEDYWKVNPSANLSTWQDCRDMCAADSSRCRAWTFDHVTSQLYGCYLKTDASKKSPKIGVFSGCMNTSSSVVCDPDIANASAPPSGMRSAVPLGSLGGGTIELCADGRLADWEILTWTQPTKSFQLLSL